MSVLRSSCLLGRLGASGFRSPGLLLPGAQVRCVTLKAVKVQPKDDPGHDIKNEKLGRPLSPHLTIYAPQLTSMMSISHRIAGMALSGVAVLLATASFSSYDMGQIAEYIGNTIPAFLLFPVKAGAGFLGAYHLCNGVRHLVWDSGKGLTLKEVYMTGYATLGASVLLTIWWML